MGEESSRTRPIDEYDEFRPTAASVVKSWRRLKHSSASYRPKRPASLLRILADIWSYPYPDFINASSDSHEMAGNLDIAFDAFVLAAKNLRDAIPESANWNAFRYLLEDRFDPKIGGHSDLYLSYIEDHLPVLADAPRMISRVTHQKRGAPVKRPSVRLYVRAICWYYVHVEKLEIRFGVDADGAVTGRLAFLVQATLEGLGLPFNDKTLVTELKFLKREISNSNYLGINFWDLIPGLPPPRKTQDAE